MDESYGQFTSSDQPAGGGAQTILVPPVGEADPHGSSPPPVSGAPGTWAPHAAAGGSGGGWGPWSTPAGCPPPPPMPSRPHPLRNLAFIAFVVALVVAAMGVGLAIGDHTAQRSPSTSSSVSGDGSSSSAQQIASKVDPALVDVNTQLGYQGDSASGTGLVLTSSGEVLTNNHVVEGATSVSVTDIGNGRTYSATVVGTDATDDIAVLKLNGASGLATVSLGNSSSASVGESVIAIGNAGGVGGTPSVSSGTITALGQSISASDEVSGTTEQLSGLIETNASLQPGDSGGPLVNSSGSVIGIDTAASSGFQFASGSTQSYAIPIDTALSIAGQIEAGQSSSTIHIGPTGFLGVEVQPTSSFGSNGSGAAVADVVPGSPADQAGIVAGDVIDSLDGKTVDSPTTLSDIMEGLHPGDTVQIGWIDSTGQQHSANVQLATGPAA